MKFFRSSKRQQPMCKTKMATNASEPTTPTRPSRTDSDRTRPAQHSPRTPSTQRRPAFPTTTTTTASSSSSTSEHLTSFATSTISSTLSSRTSLSGLRESLSQNPHIYNLSEIRSATNNFLAKRFSSSSSSSSTPSWRCTLRNTDTVIFQRKFRRKYDTAQLRQRLSVLCRSHHVSVIKLLGVSISEDYIYLVYEHVNGANLTELLRNKRNPEFTVLSTWISRMQIAADLAHGLDYIHNKTGLNISLVHNHIKSSSVIVTEPSFNAKICHFGTAQLRGEADENETRKDEIKEVDGGDDDDERIRGGEVHFDGVRGYMSPEFLATGIATQKSDVYAFGVVVLELLSGKEPFKFKYDKRRGEYVRTTVIDTAIAAVESGGGRLREWVDRRLKDSFPSDVVEKLTRLALECVHADADKRPDMGRVAGKISKMYLDSRTWSDNIKFPDPEQMTVSLAPR